MNTCSTPCMVAPHQLNTCGSAAVNKWRAASSRMVTHLHGYQKCRAQQNALETCGGIMMAIPKRSTVRKNLLTADEILYGYHRDMLMHTCDTWSELI